MINYIDTLLNELKVIDEYNRKYYEKLHDPVVNKLTDRAALIDGVWYPKSQLACDPSDFLYVMKWFANQLGGDE